VLGDLIDKGLLVSDIPRGPLRLGFPSAVIERWFPGLYQPQAIPVGVDGPAPASAADDGSQTAALVDELISAATGRGGPFRITSRRP
jgi:hypothetical protein